MKSDAARPAVAVRGTGSIGVRHLLVLRDHFGMAPIALPVRPARVQELRAAGFRTATSPADISDRPLAVIVATDTHRHPSDVLQWLPFAPVMVEKPLAATAAGLSAIDASSRLSGHAVHVGFCFRFDPGLQLLRDRLAELGPLQSVRIECQSYLPDWRPETDYRRGYSARADEGGVLRDLAHELDYAVWLFGRPAAVLAIVGDGRALGIEADATADLLWRVPDGPVVSVRLDYVTRSARRRLCVTGAEGEAEWNALTQTVTIRPRNGTPEQHECAMTRDAVLARQTEAFLASAAGKDSGSLATLDEAAFIVALSDAARRSSGSGRAEQIEDWRRA